MTGLLAALLAVMLVSDPAEIGEAEAVDVGAADPAGQPVVETRAERARITSRTSDFDRQEGVAMFEGGVVVNYDNDYVMQADRLYVFLSGSNELSRIVATGHVVITNETRVGSCAMATFRRRKAEIEMFWNGKDKARLADSGESSSVLEGSRIKFWLDSEQVEVDDSQIAIKSQGKEMELYE